MYETTLEEEETMCILSETIEPAWLWHNRLGHVSFSSLKYMSNASIVEGLPKIDNSNSTCEG